MPTHGSFVPGRNDRDSRPDHPFTAIAGCARLASPMFVNAEFWQIPNSARSRHRRSHFAIRGIAPERDRHGACGASSSRRRFLALRTPVVTSGPVRGSDGAGLSASTGPMPGIAIPDILKLRLYRKNFALWELIGHQISSRREISGTRKSPRSRTSKGSEGAGFEPARAFALLDFEARAGPINRAFVNIHSDVPSTRQ